MSRYPDVISFAKNRYTSIQASGGMSGFKHFDIKDRQVAEFKILTNDSRVKQSFRVFMSDMKDYCKSKKGIFEDWSSNSARLNKLLKKYTTKKITTYNVTASFECGPPGHGTISSDWTKFNPAVCRQLDNQELQRTVTTSAIDTEKVWEKYSMLPRFVCRDEKIKNRAVFIGTAHEKNRGKTGSFGDAIQLIVRLNQSNNNPILLDDMTQIY